MEHVASIFRFEVHVVYTFSSEMCKFILYPTSAFKTTISYGSFLKVEAISFYETLLSA
jgi:hypothetical protein